MKSSFYLSSLLFTALSLPLQAELKLLSHFPCGENDSIRIENDAPVLIDILSGKNMGSDNKAQGEVSSEVLDLEFLNTSSQKSFKKTSDFQGNFWKTITDQGYSLKDNWAVQFDLKTGTPNGSRQSVWQSDSDPNTGICLTLGNQHPDMGHAFALNYDNGAHFQKSTIPWIPHTWHRVAIINYKGVVHVYVNNELALTFDPKSVEKSAHLDKMILGAPLNTTYGITPGAQWDELKVWSFDPNKDSLEKVLTTLKNAEKGTSSLIKADISNNTPKYPYGIPKERWDEDNGNHRAVLEIKEKTPLARLNFEWRRPDKGVDLREFRIINAKTGKAVENIHRLFVNRDRCEIEFGPIETAGTYYFYYLPYKPYVGHGGGFWGSYHPKEKPASQAWLDSIKGKKPLLAHIIKVESRTKHDSFYPMNIMASKTELQTYKDQYNAPYWIFPEDRTNSIRQKYQIPLKWVTYKQGSPFQGKAHRYEYYCYQLGVLADETALNKLKVTWSPLKNGTHEIPAKSVTCFNTEGYNPYGEYFKKDVTVKPYTIQPLWMGVDIAKDQAPGIYKGSVTIEPEGMTALTIPIEITVDSKVLEDRGDDNPYNLTRLRWLNSPLGISDKPTYPYTPISKEGSTLSCLNRQMVISKDSPLPDQINVGKTSILESPIRFIIETEQGIKTLSGQPKTESLNEGKTEWTWTASDDEVSVTCKAIFEFDGWSNYTFTIDPKKELKVKDIRLEIPMKQSIGKYVVGMGLPGQDTPELYSGKWEANPEDNRERTASIPVTKEIKRLWPFDSFWLGSEEAGIHCELRGSTYHGPLLNLYRPPFPVSWNNEGKGGFYLQKKDHQSLATIYSGERTLEPGKPLDFEFSLIITPVKKIDYKSQFVDRYFHSPEVKQENLDAGIKIINVHHANWYNPLINYPFLTADRIRDFADKYHQKGIKTKIYYTIRELSSALPELWMLRSLGNEILAPGGGGGYTWLTEQVPQDYATQWYSHTGDAYPELTVDAALLTATGDSRWFNYYIEGLGWLVKNAHIDGIYLDDVSFDRRILKRMRRAMEAVKPGCIIDLHSNTGFSIGPANQYTDFFPYVDKIWFGESFNYNTMTPANWITETSGIPFGLMGDMLQAGGNRWLGMQYGMTVRYPWETAGLHCDPRPVWKIWDEFSIEKAHMLGFWNDNIPVTTSDPDVKPTIYVKKGKSLLSIGNYSDVDKPITLKFDWKKIGLNPKKVTLSAPAIKDFQEAQTWKPEDTITVPPRKGFLIYLEEK